MKDWTFSWRAVVGWTVGALVAGMLYGADLLLTAFIISPDEIMPDLPMVTAALLGAGIVIFLILGGVFELIASVGARLWRGWPRPWLEMALCAFVWFGLTHWWGININFADNDKAVSAASNGLVFFSQDVAPAIAGLIAPLIYWLIAKPKRS